MEQKKFAVKPEKNARKENRIREIIKINCVSLFLRESCCVFGMKVRPFQQTGTRKCFISVHQLLAHSHFQFDKIKFLRRWNTSGEKLQRCGSQSTLGKIDTFGFEVHYLQYIFAKSFMKFATKIVSRFLLLRSNLRCLFFSGNFFQNFKSSS